MRLLFPPCAAALLLFAASCGPEAKAPALQDDGYLSLPTGVELARRGFGQDPYAIGAGWYSYDDLSTHLLIPRPIVYVLEHRGAASMLELVSYYDDEGTSGYLTLKTRDWVDGAWGEIVTTKFDENVKSRFRTGPDGESIKDSVTMCYAIAPLTKVACDGANAALVFRTGLRPIPELASAAEEPVVYTTTHFTEPERAVRVSAVLARNIEDVSGTLSEIQAMDTRGSAAADPIHSRVGWIQDAANATVRQDIHLQITATKPAQIAQWQATAIASTDQDRQRLSVAILCQRIDFQTQSPMPSGAGTSRDIDLPTTGYSMTLVRLCEPEDQTPSLRVVSEHDAPFRGQWPDASSYDLMIEQLDGRISIRPAPGNHLWNWTQADGQGSQTFAPVDITDLWSDWSSWNIDPS